jgi:hypothetical protein
MTDTENNMPTDNELEMAKRAVAKCPGRKSSPYPWRDQTRTGYDTMTPYDSIFPIDPVARVRARAR